MNNYFSHLTLRSENTKTGPIPVSTVGRETCPKDCGQSDTCYAKFGPLSWHWDKVSNGVFDRGWDTFCDRIRRLPHNQLWRHAQAGDLPGDGVLIDKEALGLLVKANSGKRGFTYSHYSIYDQHNRQCIETACELGFTVNVSCDSLTEADRAYEETMAPLVVVLPSTTTEKALYTAEGNKVVVCPATYRDDVTCWNCGICYESDPARAIIGFKAHGTRKRVIDIRLAS